MIRFRDKNALVSIQSAGSPSAQHQETTRNLLAMSDQDTAASTVAAPVVAPTPQEQPIQQPAAQVSSVASPSVTATAAAATAAVTSPQVNGNAASPVAGASSSASSASRPAEELTCMWQGCSEKLPTAETLYVSRNLPCPYGRVRLH